MKNIFLLFALLGIFIFAAADVEKTQNLITVSALGEVEAEPDIAVVAVGVTTTELQPVDAYNKNNKTMEKVIEALKGAGIDKKDIKTTAFSLEPQYAYTNQERKLTGYQMSHQLSVKIRKLENTGTVLSKVADAGANDIGSITFTIDDPAKLQSVARERAVKTARAQAEEMAKAAGVKVGKVAQISEGGGYRPVQSNSSYEGLKVMTAVSPAPIQAGSLTIQISVTIQYEIEQ